MGRFITYDVVPSIAYCTNDIQFPNVNTTVWTFTGKAIGTAAADRLVIVSTWVIKPGATTRTWTASIGGVSATEFAGAHVSTSTGASTDVEIRMFAATVASGTTANIVITTSGSTTGCAIGVWSAYNLASTTPVAAVASIAMPRALSLNVSAAGVACGLSFHNVSSTWTGMTEDFDNQIAGLQHSGASYTATSAQSPLSVTVTPSSGTGGVGNAVSFR